MVGAGWPRAGGGSCGGAGASRPRAALAEGGGAGGQPGAAAETARRQQSPLPPDAPGDMLTDDLVEEFEIEDEPWYDHRDLQQGEGEVARGGGWEARGGGWCGKC